MNENLTDDNNSWNKSVEKTLTKWHMDAVSYNWKHNNAAKSYSFRDRLLGIPAVIATAVTGTAVFIVLDIDSRCDMNSPIQITIGTISIITAILLAVQNFLRLSELAEKHKSSANRYKSFATSIESELGLARSQRLNGKIFIKQAQKRFSELLEICPNIPDRVESRFIKTIKQNNGEFNNLNEIFIDDENLNVNNNINRNDNDDNDDNISTNNSIKNSNTLQDEIDYELHNLNTTDKINAQIENLQGLQGNYKKVYSPPFNENKFLSYF